MKTVNIDGRNVALQLWDTAGQERFHLKIIPYVFKKISSSLKDKVIPPMSSWLSSLGNNIFNVSHFEKNQRASVSVKQSYTKKKRSYFRVILKF